MRIFILGILFCFSMGGCAQESGASGSLERSVPKPPIEQAPEPEKGVKVILPLFGASWCTWCKVRFPEIQSELDKLSKSDRSLIELRLYCVDETQNQCDIYRDKLKLSAEAFPDPQWKLFGLWVDGNRNARAIPAAAILNADSTKVLKSFKAGNSFISKEVVRVAVEKAKQQ